MVTKIAYMFGGMNRGGAETIMLDVFRNADKVKFPFIGVHRKGGTCKEDFYETAPLMYQLAPKRFGYIRYFMRLRKLFKEEAITVVHTQHWLDCIYAWFATIGMRVQIVNTFHGFYSIKGVMGALCRISIRMADEVCFVSRYEQEWYQCQMRIAEEKCHVIYNGVDFTKLESVSEGISELPNEFGIRLCMVGNFMSGRDHLTLIKALQLLPPSFDFYLIGRRSDAEPQIYDECVRICNEHKMSHIHFLGGRNDVPVLLKSMDGFVYSTDHDTFGIAVVEAMAIGLPIVVNDWPVMKEVCGENIGNAVTYFKSKDVEDCVNTIAKLLTQIAQPTKEFKKQCVNNANWVHGRYSIKVYVQRLNEVYSLLANR